MTKAKTKTWPEPSKANAKEIEAWKNGTEKCDERKEGMPIGTRLKLIFFNITVEPLMFMQAASFMMMYVIAQSLKIYKICRGTFHLPDELCRNLTSNLTLEREVQQVASNYGMYWSLIQTVPSTVFIIFLGPWSDRRGRKLPMIISLVGALMSSVVLLLTAHYDELPPEFLLVAPVFIGLSGGIMALVVAVFSYITDVTAKESRTMRMALVYGLWYLGSPVGSMLGGFLLARAGYEVVFMTSALLLVACIIYVFLRIQDVAPPQSEAYTSKGCLRDIFNLQSLTESFKTCLKPRVYNRRFHLWVLTFCMCGIFLPLVGEGNVRLLYARYKFNWEDSFYSYYLGAIMATGSFGTLVLLPLFTKVFYVRDSTMAILGVLAKIGCEFITAFSISTWMMFLAPATVFYECAGPPLRSLMSKCVEPDEVGKMFTMLAVVEAGLPVVSGVMYSQVYNKTMKVFPGTVFLVSAVILFTVTIALVWLRRDVHRQEKLRQSDEEAMEQTISKDEANSYASTNKSILKAEEANRYATTNNSILTYCDEPIPTCDAEITRL